MTHAIINVETKRVIKDSEGHAHIYSTKANADAVHAQMDDAVKEFTKVVPW